MSTPAAAVTLHNLTVSYRQHPALHHVSGQFAQGSLTAVIGPNGAGKSTLLKSLAGLLPLDPQFQWSARPPCAWPTCPSRASWTAAFRWTCATACSWACGRTAGAWGRCTPAMQARVDAALQAVGLQGFERRPVGTLSSGQLQRTLVCPPAGAGRATDPAGRTLQRGRQRKPPPACWRWCSSGTVRAAPWWPCCMTTRRCTRTFPQTLLLARECIAWGPTDRGADRRKSGTRPRHGRGLGRDGRLVRLR